jgi:serine/threonine protein kinase
MSSGQIAVQSRTYHKVGDYEVLAHIATGGMGVVYRARHAVTGQEAALKVLSPALAVKPIALERFKREAQAGVKLRHDNLVAIHEFGQANHVYFMAQEYVEGIDLHEYISHLGKLETAEAVYFAKQAAGVLDYLHSQHIIHRDIKPANFLVTEFDNRLIIKLTDLGLARELTDEDHRVTRAGNTVGTIDYMAPEQARDSSNADVRSDLYALGCTLYHMLSGHPPFDHGGLSERLYQHAEAMPRDLREINAEVSEPLMRIVDMLLAKRPQDRYQTPAELLEDLDCLEKRRALRHATTPVRRRPAQSAPPSRPAPATAHADDLSTRITEINIQAYPGPAEMSAARLATEASPGVSSSEDLQAAASQFALAQKAMSEGRVKEALTWLQGCCKLEPSNLVYRQELRRLGRSLSTDPKSAGWISRIGLVVQKARLKAAMQKNDFAGALRIGEEILTRSPLDAATHIEMAEAADLLGLEHVATWILEYAWRENTHSSALNRALAKLYEKRGAYKIAAALWKMVLHTDPYDSEAIHKTADLAARVSIARGRYEPIVDAPRSPE